MMRDIGKAETWGSKDKQDDVSTKNVCSDCDATWWG